ncbi:MAG: class I SAM-dependent methyltransferase [Thermomicrobiales bacterium]
MATRTDPTSTGHHLSDASYIDLHFEVNRPEYTAIVNRAGFEPGWHVLDAGCGTGSFLPLIAEIVGPDGEITAIDLAPENVEIAAARLNTWNLPCAASIQEASIFSLPFGDDSLDAIWCANVTQYLTEDELVQAIAEFRRVTRPGGLVAIKDVLSAHVTVEPAPAGIIHASVDEEARQGGIHAQGAIRTWNLTRFLERAGLESVTQKAAVVERRAPLNHQTYDLYAAYFKFMGHESLQLSLSDEFQEFWEKQLDPHSSEAVVNHPDFYFVEGQTLAIARVPEEKEDS